MSNLNFVVQMSKEISISSIFGPIDVAENTHLLCKGKYHCTADLLFDWFGFSCFVELKL